MDWASPSPIWAQLSRAWVNSLSPFSISARLGLCERKPKAWSGPDQQMSACYKCILSKQLVDSLIFPGLTQITKWVGLRLNFMVCVGHGPIFLKLGLT